MRSWVIPLALLVTTLALWGWLMLDWPDIADVLTQHGNGDPMSLFEGISIWPTVAIRTLSIILSLFLIWYTFRSLKLNRYETEQKIGAPYSRSWKFRAAIRHRKLLRRKVGVWR